MFIPLSGKNMDNEYLYPIDFKCSAKSVFMTLVFRSWPSLLRSCVSNGPRRPSVFARAFSSLRNCVRSCAFKFPRTPFLFIVDSGWLFKSPEDMFCDDPGEEA